MAGRKSTYDEIIVPRMEEIKEWISQGKTDKYCAERLGISARTFSKHKNSFSSFSSTIKKAREPRVEEIEDSMFKHAVGFTKKVRKAMKLKEIKTNGVQRVEQERIAYYEDEIYIPPDTAAAIFLLKAWANYSNEPRMIKIRERELAIKEKEYKDKKDKDF